MSVTPSSKINVFFDLDFVVIHPDNECTDPPTINSFFLKYGVVLPSVHPERLYYAYPGIGEFFQLLGRMDNVRISIFSAGGSGRNKDFTKKFFAKIFNEEKEVTVLSAHHLEKGIHMSPLLRLALTLPDNPTAEDLNNLLIKLREIHNQTPIITNQKNIAPHVEKFGDALEHAVLIDDTFSNIPVHAVRSALFAPVHNYERSLERPFQLFDPDGCKKIPCYLTNHDYDGIQILSGKRIIILNAEGRYFLRFSCPNQLEVRRHAITDPLLVKQLKKIDPLNLKKKTDPSNSFSTSIEDPEILEKIYSFVSKKEGFFKRPNRKLNRTFYTVGILFKSFEESNETTPFTQRLIEHQTLSLLNRIPSHKRTHYYFLGLKKLQEINPSLTFITHEMVKNP